MKKKKKKTRREKKGVRTETTKIIKGETYETKRKSK